MTAHGGEGGPQQSVPLFNYSGYMKMVGKTNTLPENDLRPFLFGLFGEVGSLMAIEKKVRRENKAYAGDKDAVIEEFGDILWYFTAFCQQIKYNIDHIFPQVVADGGYENAVDSSLLVCESISVDLYSKEHREHTLVKLGLAAANLLQIESGQVAEEHYLLLLSFGKAYFEAVQSFEEDLNKIAEENWKKTEGRFLKYNSKKFLPLPNFDKIGRGSNKVFSRDEQLPHKFKIKIFERECGKSHLQWNGVFIGDPLEDNMSPDDDFRFHDVFHLAHAAILHWSPVFRALIKHKRKSDEAVDRNQDGGRAIVVEEGLTAWIFSCAKEQKFFEFQDSLSFDLLKTVQQFVRGYEVDQCLPNLWERAILEGYRVFRYVRDNKGGIVIGDRTKRTIDYRPL